ncbi:hypothetical protein K493DRAFT_315460 [Basidiobolus meristosporus CBS 931.73]|uniref:Activator of Hsp90 ATPase AHSA1-like N-terminal domain-containing protein n=1 Tax=Basidiobolus meristosporus CBS 931.73 TaxID=1314790 RepID=A0A1Y1Y9P9_9FUNG|nr:hypothetical protein K493DRAFT_315460 [Basidiobolus meristosporus CBS 931.73]|eukprot:ORX94476.1 hypothetical protein K493DRAFT_315460 [Basidiobolus meristosporus CBS 931.73]
MANWKNVNNWHWTEKNCAPWAKQYFARELKDLTAEENGITVKTTSVTKVDGDVDLNQRKGKILTLYDLSLTLEWSGSSPDGTEAKGKINIPEVAHDSEIEDYVFEISIDEETREKRVIKEVVRTKLTKVIREKLSLFTNDLIEETATVTKSNGKTQSNTGANNASASKKSQAINTTTLRETIEFVASAHDIYETLLDQQRVSAWTRGSAKISRESNSPFEFFGGNISGSVVEAVQDKKITMKWRSKAWPEGHFSDVAMELDQGSDGDVTRGNWTQYYWNPIKATFGFGAFL